MTENLNKLSGDYAKLQTKVFSRWTTNVLRPLGIVIKDVTKELTDGVALVQLAEILTKKSAPRKWDRQPKIAIQKTQNCDLALEMFTNDGVKFVSISGKDVQDAHNDSLTLGLIWTLILKYSIGAVQDKSGASQSSSQKAQSNQPGSATQALMNWCKDEIKDYGDVSDFKQINLSIAALINNYRPDLVHFDSLDKNNANDTAKVVVDAFKALNIPVLLDVEDIANGCDDKTLFTQLALVKQELDTLPHFGEVQERGITLKAPVTKGKYPFPGKNFMLHGRLRVYKNWENNSRFRAKRQERANLGY
ncbi:hypothetical protein TRFO_24170 [Tritrichomonas foetus]|uniref:Calponin-homology (CH) domain-containing protein n=1 Tax=Tritrichomonas foetus TaxID=1144522 RepID=A0A1J4KD27_9EUKA|nr:hypothetical protein TRFO_24170 [Tritrichomonas foetus]|eukprot:OHT07604.1 hypothetical protein TRFO_24170 [Tritrichomonas foetus]